MDDFDLIAPDAHEPGTWNNEADDNLSSLDSSLHVEEVRLQQERFDYLRSQKQREEADATFARRFQDDELLRVQREKLLREMKDEELARRLQEQDENIAAEAKHRPLLMPRDGSESGAFSNTGRLAMASLDVDELCDTMSASGYHNSSSNVWHHTDQIFEDEQLARILQQQEQEAAGSRTMVTQPITATMSITGPPPYQLHADAHLAHVMQQSERISALRRNFSGGVIARQMSAPVMSGFAATGVPTDPPPRYSETEQEQEVEQFDGVLMLHAVTDEPLPGNGDHRRRHKGNRRSSCKQQ